MTLLRDIQNRIKNGKCEVIGLGRSNYPLIDYLLKNGAENITARDLKTPSKEIMEKYQALGVKFVCDDRYLQDIGGKDTVIFRTPGIRPDVPEINEAVSRGALISSEMELFMLMTPTRCFGITGSDGKTTTTTIIHKLLSEIGTSYVGGNIGRPLLPDLSDMKADDYAVLELSSFQLQGISVSPSVAVITNITPNHLNWHKDMNEYIYAKTNIFLHGCTSLVVNADNRCTVDTLNALKTNARITAFSSTLQSLKAITERIPSAFAAIYLEDGNIVYENLEDVKKCIISADKIKIPGKHNIENYMAAIGATYGYVSCKTIEKVASTFGGVEHRLEFVREFKGVKYYNSSIDSSPTRTAAALSALEKKPIIICGGSDKHIPLDGLALTLCRKAKTVVLTGETAPLVMKALSECGEFKTSGLTVKCVKEYVEAFTTARDIAKPGDIVLLSPAFASFDAFKNFEERGRLFKETVNSFK